MVSGGSWRRIIEEHRIKVATEEYPQVTLTRAVARIGDVGVGADDIRAAMTAHGFMRPGTGRAGHYDQMLSDAVRRFQVTYGLEPDGIVGQETRAAIVDLRSHLLSRIDQALAQPDLPREADSIVVNIPAQQVRYYKDNEVVFSGAAIVGRRSRQTPVLDARITGITFNPSWFVPPGIEASDILPAMAKDPGFTARKGLVIYDPTKGWAEVDPAGVDWTTRPDHYTFVQKPSLDTALGEVKLEMWNRHYVFLHDTPDRSLFDREERTLSSGCVRVHGIAELARLLIGEKAWISRRVSDRLPGDTTFRVDLADPLPVHLVYRLVDLDEAGEIRYYRDVYGKLDAPLPAGHSLTDEATRIDESAALAAPSNSLVVPPRVTFRPLEQRGSAPRALPAAGHDRSEEPAMNSSGRRQSASSRWGTSAVPGAEWEEYRARVRGR